MMHQPRIGIARGAQETDQHDPGRLAVAGVGAGHELSVSEAPNRRSNRRPPIWGAASGALCLALTAAALLATIDVGVGGLLPVVAPIALVAGMVVVALRTRHDPAGRRALRTVVIGTNAAAHTLAEGLAGAGVKRYVVVGSVSPSHAERTLGALGTLADLRRIVEEHRVDLLLMTSDVPRLEVFDQLVHSCAGLPVRLCELSLLYEEEFGHIPTSEINSAWFQYVLHPRFRPTPGACKRAVDLALATVIGLIFLPLLLVLAVLIRRDGGPALFRQTRIGEGGRAFTIFKLRTMRVTPVRQAAWSAADDPRVTRIGRVLRRTHIDELPQLLNVMRGEMTIVGPRPEQPEFVADLERELPFYSCRHRLRPGLTGWAQVRCGYAGSEFGSAWKLSYDLYYLKHRSLRLDFKILFETFAALWREHQYEVELHSPFVVRPAFSNSQEEPRLHVGLRPILHADLVQPVGVEPRSASIADA